MFETLTEWMATSAIVMGSILLVWLLVILMLTRCGTRATKMEPIFCALGLGLFFLFAGLQMRHQNRAWLERHPERIPGVKGAGGLA